MVFGLIETDRKNIFNNYYGEINNLNRRSLRHIARKGQRCSDKMKSFKLFFIVSIGSSAF